MNTGSVPRIVIILLTWKRIHNLPKTLTMLAKQTYSNFEVVISHSNPTSLSKVRQMSNRFNNELDLEVIEGDNRYKTFRRFFTAKEKAEQGADIVFLLDDDISIPDNYIEKALEQFEEYTYHSCYTWYFDRPRPSYLGNRTKVFNNNQKIHYAGAGVSMIDARVFLDERLFDCPEFAYQVDDLWMSYFFDHVLKRPLKHLDIPNVHIGGGDSVAMYKAIARSSYTKDDCLYNLVDNFNWQIS